MWEEIDVSVVATHLRDTRSSFVVGDAFLNAVQQARPLKAYAGVLTAEDTPRVYLLRCTELRRYTRKGSRKVEDLIIPTKISKPKKLHPEDSQKTLLDDWSRAPVLVTPGLLEGLPLAVLDGNHRVSHHYCDNRTLAGVHVYVLSHPNFSGWVYFPENVG